MHLEGAKDFAAEVRDSTLAIFLQFETPEQARAAFLKFRNSAKQRGHVELKLSVGPEILEN